jgi:pimeloyl-ACP methyl ester carboxylesterase
VHGRAMMAVGQGHRDAAARLLPDMKSTYVEYYRVCRNRVKPGNPPVVARSNVDPSLLLTGAIDPITPPRFARIVAAKMGPATQVVEFLHVGHDVEESSACGASLVIPAARNADSSSISGGWYRARGWWGGRAPNRDSCQWPDAGRTVSH